MLTMTSKQSGFSLIELMISLSIGLLMLGGILQIFSNTVRSDSEFLMTGRLQNELRTSMAVMQNDIRRAGYWSNSLPTYGAKNPFTAANTDLTILDGGSCILFTYDLNKNGVIDNNTEYFGFRLNGNTIEMRVAGTTTSDCHVSNTEWEPVTDPTVTTITDLKFDNSNYVCTNLTYPADVNCVAPSPGDITQTIRQIAISISGYVTSKTTIARSINESVRVRNDRLQKI